MDEASCRPAPRPKVTVVVEGGLQPSDLVVEPLNVALTAVGRFRTEAAKCDTVPWELAPGTWRLGLRDAARLSTTWTLAVAGGGGEAGNELTVTGDAEVRVTARRQTGCALAIASEPAGMDATLVLRATWPGGGDPRPVRFGTIDNLTAGDYELEIDDSTNAKYLVDDRKLALVAGRPRPTVALHVAVGKNDLSVSFRDRKPPCQLPFAVAAASYLVVAGERVPGLISPGAAEVPLDPLVKAGEAKLFTQDGDLEYYRGKITAGAGGAA